MFSWALWACLLSHLYRQVLQGGGGQHRCKTLRRDLREVPAYPNPRVRVCGEPWCWDMALGRENAGS
jgi:hypothetical protein